MRYYWVLQKMSLRAYYRNRQALAFGLFFPIIIIVIFGLLNFGGATKVDIGVVDQSGGSAGALLLEPLRHIDAVNLHTGGSQSSDVDALKQGNRALVAVPPPGLGQPNGPSIAAYLNQGGLQQAQVGVAILNQVANQASFQKANIQRPAYAVQVQSLPGKSQSYTDFLVPGIIGLTIMLNGIFGIAFALPRLRQSGVLRRLLATPMRRLD